jgi:hypothetical protein
MENFIEKLRRNPTATFQVQAPLPSGILAHVTIGPMVNSEISVMAHIEGAQGPPTEEDIQTLAEVVNQIMGQPAEEVLRADDAEGFENLQKIRRQRLGGGIG